MTEIMSSKDRFLWFCEAYWMYGWIGKGNPRKYCYIVMNWSDYWGWLEFWDKRGSKFEIVWGGNDVVCKISPESEGKESIVFLSEEKPQPGTLSFSITSFWKDTGRLVGQLSLCWELNKHSAWLWSQQLATPHRILYLCLMFILRAFSLFPSNVK